MTDHDQAIRLLRKFANHKGDCYCFICRTLTPEEKVWLTEHNARGPRE